MVWGGAQSCRHAGIRRPCHSPAEQCYQRRAAAWNSEDSWLVPRHGVGCTHTASSTYIDVDVQYTVRLTHRLDDNMMYILNRVNLRNTLAIVCAATAFIHTFPSNPHDAFRYPIMPYFGKIKPIRVRHTFATTTVCSHLL